MTQWSRGRITPAARACRWLLAALTLALLAPQALAQQVQGYVAWWMGDTWRDANLAQIDRLHFFELRLAPDGTLAHAHGWPDAWSSLRTQTRAVNVPLDVTLTALSRSDFDRLFGSAGARAQLLRTCLALLNQGVDGLQLDIEVETPPAPALIARYRDFVLNLSQTMRDQYPDRKLSAFWQWQQSPNLYDNPTLARLDQVVTQGYDAHTPGSSHAGPIAPLSGPDVLAWDKALATIDATGLPRERFVMSFPLFGYEWPVAANTGPRSAALGSGRSITYAPQDPRKLPDIQISAADRAQLAGFVRDEAAASTRYTLALGDGSWVEGWFEDGASVKAHWRFLHDKGLGGLSFFVLGYDQHRLLELAQRLKQAKTR